MRYILLGTALAVTPVTAVAQTTICGGISMVGEWVGGDEASSDVSTTPDLFDLEGQVPIAGHFVRMFTLSTPTDVRVDVAAVPAGDPYIALYDAEGAEVAADDDSGGNFGSRVQATLEPGSYCLAARSYESGVTDVSVQIGRSDQTFPTAAAPPVTPLQMTGGTGCFQPDTAMLGRDLLRGNLGDGLEAVGLPAAYGFSLAEELPLSISASSDAGDPVIRLRDTGGTLLAENDDFDGLNSRIDMTAPLAPGEYCVEVEDYNGGQNQMTVTLDLFDAAAERLRRLNNAEFAPTPEDAVSVTDLGTLSTSILRDVDVSSSAQWFRFDMPEGGLFVAEAIGNGSDPSIILFDRVGRRVGENDDGPNGLDSFLVTRMMPGSYTMAVRLFGEGARGNVRLLMERYVPAE